MIVLGFLVVERLLDVTILLVFFLVGMIDLREIGVNVVYLHWTILVATIGAMVWVILLWTGRQADAFLVRHCRGEAARQMEYERHGRVLYSTIFHYSQCRAHARLCITPSVVFLCYMDLGRRRARGCCRELSFYWSEFGPGFALAAGSLATMIPRSPGYIGTFEFFTSSAL